MLPKEQISPSDVNSHKDLITLAQQLCDAPNNIDGIIIVSTRTGLESPEILNVRTDKNFESIDPEALWQGIYEIIKSSSDIIISTKGFSAGNIRSMLYEYENVAFAIYTLAVYEKNTMTCLALVNTKDKDLGAFNLNRGRVRAKIETGFNRLRMFG